MNIVVQGHLQKMAISLPTVPEARATYQLHLGDQIVAMNDLIGQEIKLTFKQIIQCQHCGKKTNKSYAQGYCFQCMQMLPECDICIMSPEKCHYDQGTCRDGSWGEKFCFQPHVVYLANSSGLKVGITRVSQMPTRWLDQGAIQAIPIMQVVSRKLSGQVETALKAFVTDKTNWRALLKEDSEPVDMVAEKKRLKSEAISALVPLLAGVAPSQYQWLDTHPIHIHYPVTDYPTKIVSHNLDKEPVLQGRLLGIKGQYWLFADKVINIRKYTSYWVEFSA